MNQDPLSSVIDILQKLQEESLAEKVLDAFGKVNLDKAQNDLMAKLYHDLKKYDKSLRYAVKVLNGCDTVEEKISARSNMARIYCDMFEPEKALPLLRANNALVENNFDIKFEMIRALYQLNRKDEAYQILKTYLDNNDTRNLSEEQRALIDLNKSSFDLARGKFLLGLREFFFSIEKLGLWFNHNPLPFQMWNGGTYPGTTIIMNIDGAGIGDEMLVIRFYKHLKNKRMNPLFYTKRHDMFNIFNRCGYDTIMDLNQAPVESMWVFALHIPIYLGLQEKDIYDEKYLWPSDEARNKWSTIKNTKKKIGIRWMGAEGNETNLYRNVPLSDIMNMLNQVYKDDEVEYYSLQVKDGENDLINYPNIKRVQLDSYDDTLALLENLDLVITTCTSVLHASAIVGTETLALIPIISYFPWQSPPQPGRPSNTSIWYGDNLKMFKQVTPKKWNEPIQQIQDHLINLNTHKLS